jgi:predicted dehydrogenase
MSRTAKQLDDAGPSRVGIVGFGTWAKGNHLPVIASRGDAALVAVCDLRPAALAEAKLMVPDAYRTSDLDDFLARDLDAVIVATPNAEHFEPALAALRSGRHVLVEKPLAGPAGDAWHLVAEARRRHLHLMVPLGYNFWGLARQARDRIASGVLGRLELVSVHLASPMRSSILAITKGEARPETDSVAGYSYAQLTHALGLALWMTGLRAERAYAEYGPQGAPTDLVNAVTVRFVGGAVGVVAGSAFDPAGSYHHQVRVYGSSGHLSLDAEVGRERLRTVAPGVDEDVRPPAGDGEYNGTRPVHSFVDLIRGLTDRNDSPGEASARVIELLHAAAASTVSGRPTTIDVDHQST